MRLFNFGVMLFMIMVLIFGMLALAAMNAAHERPVAPVLEEKICIFYADDNAAMVIFAPGNDLLGVDGPKAFTENPCVDFAIITNEMRPVAWAGSLRPGVVLGLGNSNGFSGDYTNDAIGRREGRGTGILLAGRHEPALRL